MSTSIFSVMAQNRATSTQVIALGSQLSAGYSGQASSLLSNAQKNNLKPEEAQALYGTVSQYQSTATALGNQVLTQQTGFISKDVEAMGSSNRLLA